MSVEKIGPQHRARKAVLYVRQSSVHQVQHNRESQGLQYAMRDRLLQLGWSQVEVIDEDLGVRPRAEPSAPASSAWLRRCAWARLELWPPGRSLASRATAATATARGDVPGGRHVAH